MEGRTNWVYRVRTSPDGRWVASGSWDGAARVWAVDAAPGAPAVATLTGHVKGRWLPVCWTPDGGRLVTGSGDGTLRIFDASTSATAAS
jgi:WD40 repeat protein